MYGALCKYGNNYTNISDWSRVQIMSVEELIRLSSNVTPSTTSFLENANTYINHIFSCPRQLDKKMGEPKTFSADTLHKMDLIDKLQYRIKLHITTVGRVHM